MTSDSRHVSEWIDRTAAEVYDYTADPANLPAWASGLGTSVECIDGEWVAQSPMGRVVVSFTPRNDYGVLDHKVTLPSGETVYNPLRVIAAPAGCELVFTLRRQHGASDAEFEHDSNTVAADLASLKHVLENR